MPDEHGTPPESPAHDQLGRLTSALMEAGMALGSALSLEQVLQILVDVARELVGARYAALGVINAERTGLSDFVTSGMSAAVRERIGALPRGKGILGLLIRDARPLRLRDMREHSASVGVPEHHPLMRSFMGVPITAQARVFGNLYVTEKIGAEEFSEADLELLEVLATQAAVAIENAQLRATRDRVVAAARHALGNALAGIRLWTGTLLKSKPERPEMWTDGVRRIAAGAAQATRLVDDLIALAQIQENRVDLHLDKVDIADLITRAVHALQTDAEMAGVTVDVQLNGTLHAHLDEARTQRALENILAHAIAVSEDGSQVMVSSTRDLEGAILVHVQDTGPPLVGREMETLFEPEISAGVHAGGRRFGFELAVSRQLARLMGGEVTVEPQDTGARFTLCLPPVMRDSA